jgi:hypothetical protein
VRHKRDEALQAYWLNMAFASSSNVFRLITFSQRHVETCEDDGTGASHTVLRDDENKRAAFRSTFHREPVDTLDQCLRPVIPEFASLASSGEHEVQNEEIKRIVTMPSTS